MQQPQCLILAATPPLGLTLRLLMLARARSAAARRLRPPLLMWWPSRSLHHLLRVRLTLRMRRRLRMRLHRGMWLRLWARLHCRMWLRLWIRCPFRMGLHCRMRLLLWMGLQCRRVRYSRLHFRVGFLERPFLAGGVGGRRYAMRLRRPFCTLRNKLSVGAFAGSLGGDNARTLEILGT